ncbi:MAG: TIGR01212 family radical SAM protein [Bacteroidetes bacterium]|nr:MAG: TIGR01212 family radical SAM protein [Bacteroidota bacterium]PIE88051.1 MAG: TIGR01212 family radical SAM protein [Bacteroidota bacterium]
MSYPWGNTRRFNAYSDYFKSLFGQRVQKLSVDAGFSCPNRDGTVATGGCTFCDSAAFSPSYCQPHKGVRKQLEEGMAFHQKRYRRTRRYLAYFQAYSNTHAPLDQLKPLYREALDTPGVVGLVIGTRPDCVDPSKLDFLASLTRDYYVVVEYGIESCYDATLQRINRGHTFDRTVYALEETAARGIRTGGHLIFGLPGETREMMLHEARILSELPLDTVKFHQLQMIKGTAIAQEFLIHKEDFLQFELDDYLLFISSFLTQLRPGIVVERVAGEVPPAFLLEPPRWKMRYDQVLQRLEALMEEQACWQGKYYQHTQ